MHTTNSTMVLMFTAITALMGSLAAPSTASADTSAACDQTLKRLSAAGEDLGYEVDLSASRLVGTRQQSLLSASCSQGLVELELREGRGPTVSVNFNAVSERAFALELHGEYPGVGSISRIAMLEEPNSGSLTGSLHFAADVGTETAFAEFDLAGELVASGGDAGLANNSFALTLGASAIWKDAHVFTFALADIWDSGISEHEAGLDGMLELAIPSPDPLQASKSVKAQLLTCGAAALTCGASWWFPPAAGSCVGQASACALSIACTLADCLD